ncbi:MAG: BamA/TamA family outer membrane protein [Candidatus Glassbacteria bacterium]|nr:BamA/TamA family outer membrane protein [Candidatus Glassbacteria bacterium]
MDSRNGLTGIPLHERFYAGGPHSLRAFSYQKAGPLDRDRMPIGGRLKLVWNVVELRRTLYKLVGGVLFVDVGNVWLDPGSFALDEIRTSIGCGLRLNTPIGMGRLDYGYNPERRPGEPRGKLYFSMGQAF